MADPYDALVPVATPAPSADPYDALAHPPPRRPMKNVTPKATYETAPDKRPSPLRVAGEYFAAPMSLLSAAVQSLPGQPAPPPGPYHSNLGRAVDLVRHGGVEALNREYDPYTDATLRRYGIDPAKVPGFLKGLGELGLQWYNPVNKPLGAISNLALKYGVGPAFGYLRSTYPAVDAAAASAAAATAKAQEGLVRSAVGVAKRIPGQLGNAARIVLDRYANAGLPQRGGMRYVTAALAAQSVPEHAAASMTNAVRRQMDGLTSAQKIEVQRLSFRHPDGTRIAERDPNVPQPKKGPSLEERAAWARSQIIGQSAALAQRGILADKEAFDPNLYWPMQQYKGKPVYQEFATEPDPLTGQPVPVKTRRGAGGFKSSIRAGGRKVFATILGREAELHPDYDAAWQLEQGLSERARALANEDAKVGLEQVPSVDPNTGIQRRTGDPGFGERPSFARMPLRYYIDDHGDIRVFGEGATGHAAMEKYIQREAAGRAQAAAREDPRMIEFAKERGVNPRSLGTRQVIARAMAPVRAKLSEAQRGGKVLEAGQERVAETGTATEAQARKLAAAVKKPGELRTAARAAWAERRDAIADAANVAIPKSGWGARADRVLHGWAEDIQKNPRHAQTGRYDEEGRWHPPAQGGTGDQWMPTKADLKMIRGDLKKLGVVKSDDEIVNAIGGMVAGIERGQSGDIAAAQQAVESARTAYQQAATAARAAGKVPAEVRRASAATLRAADKALNEAYWRAGRLNAKEAERVAKMTQRYQEQAARSETAAEFQRVTREHYADVFETLAAKIRNEAGHAPAGYVRESALGMGSPTGTEMALDDSFAKFFTEGGGSLPIAPAELAQADVEGAKKFWQTYQVLNRLARMAIVLVPTVHAVNNLGTHAMAEGLTPLDVAEVVAGRYKPSEELAKRAYAAGAASDTSQLTFALNEGFHTTTAVGERATKMAAKTGPLARATRPFIAAGLHTGRAYNAMNHWLFGTVEQGYAFKLFDKFTREGMTDGEAAVRVRNALGRFDNISPAESKNNLNRLFYFYPWMKTVLAFWARKGLVDPKWWAAPVRAIQTNNQQPGSYDDPSQPFTATFGKRSDGQFRRYAMLLPQRVIDPMVDLARAPIDLARGGTLKDIFAQDLTPTFNYLTGHLNVAGQIVKDAMDTFAVRDTTRTAPWNVFHEDPHKTPAQNRADQVARAAGIVASPVSRLQDLPQDPLANIAAFALGGSTYGKEPTTDKQRETAIRRAVGSLLGTGLLKQALQKAEAEGDQARVDYLNKVLADPKLQADFKEATVQAALARLNGTAPAATPTPAPTPAARDPYDTLAPGGTP